MQTKHILVAGAVGAGLYWWFTRTDAGRHLWAGLVELTEKGGHCCAECAKAASSPAPTPATIAPGEPWTFAPGEPSPTPSVVAPTKDAYTTCQSCEVR